MLSTVGGMNMAVVTGTDALFLQSSYGSYYRCGILIKNTGNDFYKLEKYYNYRLTKVQDLIHIKDLSWCKFFALISDLQ